MTDKLLVLSTAGSESEARKIAQTLVQHRLAACVNIVPKIHSVYRWKGKVEQAEEYLLVIKTLKARKEEVGHAICEVDSYQLPECIGIQVESGSAEYLKGVEDSL